MKAIVWNYESVVQFWFWSCSSAKNNTIVVFQMEYKSREDTICYFGRLTRMLCNCICDRIINDESLSVDGCAQGRLEP